MFRKNQRMTKRPSVPLIESALVCVGLVVLTWAWTSQAWIASTRNMVLFYGAEQEEMRPLSERYGQPESSSEVEWIVRDFFQDRRGGFFLDVGANDYKYGNNTYYLEKALGWSGIAIDALDEFAPNYKSHRPNSRFVAAFVSDTEDGTITFFVPTTEDKGMASSSHEAAAKWGTGVRSTQVPTTTLNAILRQAGVQRVDFLSMDIELAEPAALRGFDIDVYQPELVCIEGHPEIRQEILDYFYEHRYVLIGKYLRADVKNLYFKRSNAITPP